MDQTENRRHAARFSAARPEFVALGLLAERPMHGYELYRVFQAALGGLWRISESQMYSILKRMESRGFVHVAPARTGTAAASRRSMRLTPLGRAVFDEWLRTPSPCNPRSLRLEFISRLFFASREPAPLRATLIEHQRKAIADELARSDPTSGSATDRDSVDALAASFRAGQLRAALDWIAGIAAAPAADA